MKLIEAFDSSAPQWIKDFLSSKLRTYKPNTYARNLQDVDASTATFINVSDESVSELRKRLKSGTDLLFVLYKAPDRRDTIPVMIRYDANNTANGLKVIGSSDFKYMSFKRIIENAVEVWYTEFTEDKQRKKKDRAASRRGGIFRDKDRIYDPALHRDVDLGALKKDASGYTYDAQRLVRKLAAMHEDDSAYALDKATKIFSSMVDIYSDALKELVTNKNYSSDYFNKSSFRYITRSAQDLIDESARMMEKLTDLVEGTIETLEDYSSQYASRYDEVPDNIKEIYEDDQQRLKEEISKTLSNLAKNKQKLTSIIRSE